LCMHTMYVAASSDRAPAVFGMKKAIVSLCIPGGLGGTKADHGYDI
jgi:hypothetical protein